LDIAVTEARPDPELDAFASPRATYDTVASAYAATVLDELSHKLLDRFAAAVADRSQCAGPVCDLGCGPGHIGAYLAKRGVRTVGIDLSTSMVAEARRAFPSLAFAQGDMTSLDQTDGTFTGMACFYALIHLPRPIVPVALREMSRTLAHGGHLLLAAHGGVGSLHADVMLEQPVSLDATLFELEELIDLVERAGFTILESHQREPYEEELATPRLYIWGTRRP
jgi:SAM-dependent methyltransferase